MITETVSTDGQRRMDEGPGGFMCWQRERQFPDFIPEDSPYAYVWAQGGYTPDRAVAQRWLRGESCHLVVCYTTTAADDYELPHQWTVQSS